MVSRDFSQAGVRSTGNCLTCGDRVESGLATFALGFGCGEARDLGRTRSVADSLDGGILTGYIRRRSDDGRSAVDRL